MVKTVNPQDPPLPPKPFKYPIGKVRCNYATYKQYKGTHHLSVRIYCGDVQVLSATPEALTVRIPHNHETGARPHNEDIPFAQPAYLWVGGAK
jgi:hypothetical protein